MFARKVLYQTDPDGGRKRLRMQFELGIISHKEYDELMAEYFPITETLLEETNGQ